MEVIRAQSSPGGFYSRKEDCKSVLQAREVGIEFVSRYAGGSRVISPNSSNRQPKNVVDTGKSHNGGHWAGGIDKESGPRPGLDWKPSPQLNAFLALKDFGRKKWPDTHENVPLKTRLKIHVRSVLRIRALNQSRSPVPSASS